MASEAIQIIYVYIYMYVCIHACAHTHTHTCNNVLIQFSWYSAFLFTRRKVFLTRYTILGLCIWFLLVFVIWTNFGGYFLILSRIFAQFVRGDLEQTINTSDNCKWWLSLREDTSLLPAKDRNNTRACVLRLFFQLQLLLLWTSWFDSSVCNWVCSFLCKKLHP